MNPQECATKAYYGTDEFFTNNPNIGEDSAWKVQRLKPFLDTFARRHRGPGARVLDVGGGVGLVMKGVTEHLEGPHGLSVHGIAVEPSPACLALQRETNPALAEAHETTIQEAPLEDASVDLALAIDVLEHVDSPPAAYAALRRVAKYVLVKVPLEKNLTVYAMDILTGYRAKRAGPQGVGHINFYTYNSLLAELETHLGTVLQSGLCDVFSYLLHDPTRRARLSLPRTLYCWVARLTHRLAPQLTTLVFNDFAVVLVECRKPS